MYGDPVKEKRFHMRASGDAIEEMEKIVKEAAKLAEKANRNWHRDSTPTKTDVVMFALMKTFPRGAFKGIDKLFKQTWSNSHKDKIGHLEKISQACNGKPKKEVKKKTSTKKKRSS